MLVSYMPFDTTTSTRQNLTLKMTATYTNLVNNGQQSLSNAYRPTNVGDYMVFDGTKAVRFSENSNYPDNWHVTAPYSVECEVFLDTSDEGRWIGTVGEGYGIGWGEWSIVQSGGGIYLNSSADNNGNQFTIPFVTSAATKQWYRLGFMFYTDANNVFRIRTYCNDVKVIDQACSVPYNTSNGMSWGSDWAFTGPGSSSPIMSRVFKGRIRNVQVGRSLFWTV